MGYIKHNAIVITGWHSDDLERVAAKARDLGLEVVGPSDEVTNGYRSLLIAPDGSKEGWERSFACDDARDALVSWMEADRGGERAWYDWIEIRYGGDDDECSEIVRHSGAASPGGEETT